MSAIFVPNMIQYTGYIIPVAQMKRWLFWIVSRASHFPWIILITNCVVVLHQSTLLRYVVDINSQRSEVGSKCVAF